MNEEEKDDLEQVPPENFEDAQAAAQNLFETVPQDEEALAEQETETQIEKEAEAAGENTQQEETKTAPEQPDPEAMMQTAENAARAAQEADQRYQQAMARLQQLEEENQTLNKAIQQMSQQQEEALVKSGMEPPVIDFSAMAFEDEETVRQKQQDYTEQLTNYIRGQMMSEFEPYIRQAKEGQAQKEKDSVLSALGDMPELGGISDMIPALDNIIQNNPVLANSDVPLDEKYIMAYTIAKGIDSIKTPAHELTAEELFQMYQNNSELQDMIEKERVKNVQNGQKVPPLSVSGGSGGAALHVKEKPKTFDEASDLVRKMFGVQ